MTQILFVDGVDCTVDLVNPDPESNHTRVSVQVLQDLHEKGQERLKSKHPQIKRLLESGRHLRKPRAWSIKVGQTGREVRNAQGIGDQRELSFDLGPNELRPALVRVSPCPGPEDFYVLVVSQEIRVHDRIDVGGVVVVVPGDAR